MKKKRQLKIISCTSVISIFVLWYLSTSFGWVDGKLIPSPKEVLDAFFSICVNYKGYSLLQHIGVSMKRLFSAFGLAVVTAVPLGLLSGFSEKARAAFDPIIEFYRPLPPLAYYTLLVLALGIDDASKIALLFLACFAPIYVSCVSAVIKVKVDHINSAYTLGASKLQVFKDVIFPSCLPDMFTGIRTSIGVGYSTLVAAEMVAANVGIGWMVLDAKNWLRNDIVFAGIIVMGATGIFINFILNMVERKFVPWSGKA